jgi:TrmH family RNA methyltransferase
LGQFIVEGTTAIDSAVHHGWPISDLLYPAGGKLSAWAQGHVDSGAAERLVEIAPTLLSELTSRHEGTELLAIARPRFSSLEALGRPRLLVVLDRPKSAGNVGTIIRSALSFGASALVVTGHAADPLDPECVRASVGGLFALPLVVLPSHAPLLSWIESQRVQRELSFVGTGHRSPVLVDAIDLTSDLVVVLGNETQGLSRTYQEACDQMVRLPTSEPHSSLNVSAAAAVVLYEIRRQRLAAAGAAAP